MACLDYSISSLTYAMQPTVSKGLARLSKVQSLHKYFPISGENVMIQRFNCSAEIPKYIDSPDKLSEWILEADMINRKNVFCYFKKYLECNEELAINGLLHLTELICKLDVASSFVDGLKFFVPVIGCWEPLMSNDGRHDWSMRKVLSFYCETHLRCSKSPIIPAKEGISLAAQAQTLVDISYWLLHFMVQIENQHIKLYHRQAFHENVTMLAAPLFTTSSEGSEEDTHSARMEVFVTRLFESVRVGRPLQPLPDPATCPSYLLHRFSNQSLHVCERKTWLSIGFEIPDSDAIECYAPNAEDDVHKLLAYLTKDALYIFSFPIPSIMSLSAIDVTKSSRPPIACIPLEDSNVEEYLDMDPFSSSTAAASSGGIARLTSQGGEGVPMIEFSHSVDSEDSWPLCLPMAIHYHPSILLRVEASSDPKEEDQLLLRTSEGAWEGGEGRTAFLSFLDATSSAIERLHQD